jgi:hypothetical protein
MTSRNLHQIDPELCERLRREGNAANERTGNPYACLGPIATELARTIEQRDAALERLRIYEPLTKGA